MSTDLEKSLGRFGDLIGQSKYIDIYRAFSEYFENPILEKVKDVSNYSMYVVKNYCLLANQCRYILVFVNKNNHSPGSREYLINLEWISIQTRILPPTMSKEHSHSYQPKRLPYLNIPIERTKIEDEGSTYTCSLPLTIALLHTEKNTADDYKNKSNLISAIETFQTIINLN